MAETDFAEGSERFEVRVTADTHFGWLRTRLSVERTGRIRYLGASGRFFQMLPLSLATSGPRDICKAARSLMSPD
jgi:hypothetical protein